MLLEYHTYLMVENLDTAWYLSLQRIEDLIANYISDYQCNYISL